MNLFPGLSKFYPFEEVTIDQMIQQLKDAGWVEKHRFVWMRPDGECFRGPYGAWKVMKGKVCR